MLRLVALLTVHASVAVCPAVIAVGVAVKLLIVGAASNVVAVTTADGPDSLPAAPTLSVLAVHVRSIRVAETAVPPTLLGTVGAVVSVPTVTVAVAVTLPPLLLAVSV